MTLTRVKVITGYTANARWFAEVSENPIGEIPRRPQIPSPYAYSPTHPVWDWDGRPVIVVETRHRRYEVFQVDGRIDPVSD